METRIKKILTKMGYFPDPFAGIKFEPIPDYGELIPLEEFIQACEESNFTNNDGSGYYALKDKMTNFLVFPSEIVKGNISRRFTHVMWFNK